MIRFTNVHKTYANGHQALVDVNLTLQSGEMAFLTGHSGAGKSTLLKLLICLEKASRGSVFIDNLNLANLRERQIANLRREISFIFQDPQLLYDKTVFENVALPLVIARFHPSEIQKRVRAALSKVGLGGKEHWSPKSLSCGEQQRIGVARAIINAPRILLADEPTGNLDPDLAFEMMQLFSSFNKAGVTVLIATHNLPLIASFNHRIISLKNGRIQGDTQHDESSKYYRETEAV